jgi:hypothetical protein
MRLGHDSLAYLVVERPRQRRIEQRPRVGAVEARNEQAREAVQLVLGSLTHREHERETLRQETPRDEGERLGRDAIQPVCVVDETDERPFLGDLGQQAQDGERDEEPVGRLPDFQSKRRAKRGALRAWEVLEPVEKRRAELMQPGERQLQLRFDPRSADDSAVGCACRHVVEQSGLAHAGLAADDQDLASAVAYGREQAIQDRAFGCAAEQHGSAHLP